MSRTLSPVDRLIVGFDKGLRAWRAVGARSTRAYPAEGLTEGSSTARDRRHVAGLMRVNHSGEIAAQALYEGQAVTARSESVRDSMNRAAHEEVDHLDWCRRRLDELGSHPSRLVPLWYAGSFAMGAAAGAAGDRWSLGFVAETERQVVEHLRGHLDRLPEADARSRAILTRMAADEGRHATAATAAGGRELPGTVKRLMRLWAKFMTASAYRI